MATRKTPSAGGKPDKLMRDAISLELHQSVDVPPELSRVLKVRTIRKIRLIAIALVNAAIKGDIAAIREVNNRMDGSVPTTIRGEGENGAIPLSGTVRFVIESAPKVAHDAREA